LLALVPPPLTHVITQGPPLPLDVPLGTTSALEPVLPVPETPTSVFLLPCIPDASTWDLLLIPSTQPPQFSPLHLNTYLSLI
jgi:hypothetical protein